MKNKTLPIEIGVNVSRETLEKLHLYHQLLVKWNPSINLVSHSTIARAWERHFIDSARIYSSAHSFRKWIDLGSGAGFPGLVIAIIAAEKTPDASVHLVESDNRKCAFLRTVSRETSLNVEIHNTRIDDVKLSNFDIVSARALASLDTLLKYSESLLAPAGKCLFLKGRQYDSEISEAQENWDFRYEKIPEPFSNDGIILRIGDLRRVEKN